MRVLFLTEHAPQQIEGASSRYRVYQYLEFFKSRGIITDVVNPHAAIVHDSWPTCLR